MVEKCTNCHSEFELNKNANFCPICGCMVENKVVLTTKNNCPECKKEIMATDKFCSFCGAKIEYIDCCNINNTENCSHHPPIQSSDYSQNYIHSLKMSSAWLYGIIAFILAAVGYITEYISDKEEFTLIILSVSIVFIVLMFICVYQWCRNINNIAGHKIINPYITIGIVIGSAVIVECLGFKADCSSVIGLGVILWKLDKAYNIRKNNVPDCWNKTKKYIYGMLFIFFLCDVATIPIAQLKFIPCFIFSILIYFVQIMFNFAICSSEYKNEHFITFWKRDNSISKILGRVLVALPIVFLILGLIMIVIPQKNEDFTIRHLVMLIIPAVIAIFFNWWVLKLGKKYIISTWISKLDSEIQDTFIK
ncbi:MAG: zinc ribbon domain-containing protein [Lentisphaeria bacterium]|nr:zinc ribbon domain-containing protein [Lentisphaeria bacterium]